MDEQRALVFSEVLREMPIEDALMAALGLDYFSNGSELKIIAALAQQAGIGTIEGMVLNSGVRFDGRAFCHTYTSGMSPNMRRLLFITATLPDNIV